MKLHEHSRRAKRREATLRREVEAEPVYERSTYQPSTGSYVDCKGDCGAVVHPFLNVDGYCGDCGKLRKEAGK